MSKTLLVGLDAACWEYVQPLIEAGRLPRLEKLIDKGVRGDLSSTLPAWTPAAWASIITGKNPGKHGVFDMAWRRPGTYEFSPTNAAVRNGTPFWRRLNEAGLRVGLVNVPFTYPVEPVDGFVVAGFGTPASASGVTYPAEALSLIQERFGAFEPAVSSDFLQRASPVDILDKEVRHQATQVQIAVELAGLYQVDVLVINLMLPDHANHKMPTMEMVQESYYKSDNDLGSLIDAFDPDNVMLISDHGSNRLKGDFLLYAWLRDNGYYVSVENDELQKRSALNQLLRDWHRTRFGLQGPLERAVRFVTRESFFNLPGSAQARLWNQLKATFPLAEDYVLYGNQPDYKRTRVFPGTAYAGLLYLNLDNREPEGVIPLRDRQATIHELKEQLMEISDPKTSAPLFANVYSGEEIYSGQSVSHSPDLILDSYDSGWNIRSTPYSVMPTSVRDRYFVESTNEGRDFGWHSKMGLYAFSGPAFRMSDVPGRADLLDIPATLLHLHNVPIPDDFDGKVLIELLSNDLSHVPVRFQPGDDEGYSHGEDVFTAAEADEVNRHLRALGYLD